MNHIVELFVFKESDYKYLRIHDYLTSQVL